MYLDAVLVVNVPHDIITRNGMTTVCEDKLIDVLFCNDERFLLIEILAYNKQLLRLDSSFSLFLVFGFAKEWNIVAPAGGLLWLFVFPKSSSKSL